MDLSYNFVSTVDKILTNSASCGPSAAAHFLVFTAVVLDFRLHSTNYVAAKHLLHNGAVPTASSTSEAGGNSDQNLLCRYGCSHHLANTYRRLTNLGFRTVCLVVLLLAVYCHWFPLRAHVFFGFLPDAAYRGRRPDKSGGIQCGHSICLYFRLLRELVGRPNTLLVCDGLCAHVL